MANRISLVISTLEDRLELFERSLFGLCCWQSYDPATLELVVVLEKTDRYEQFYSLLQQYRDWFYRIQLIEIDSWKVPRAPCGNAAVGINVGVKAAENDAIIKTDAECIFLGETIQTCQKIFDPSQLLFFTLRKLTEVETRGFALEHLRAASPETICGSSLVKDDSLWLVSQRQQCAYWFGVLFSRTKFLEVGGVDENFMLGFAGEDDEWAIRTRRCGVLFTWNDGLRLLHQYHTDPSVQWGHSEFHQHNIHLLNESSTLGKRYANLGQDWGSSKVILRREVITGIRHAASG